MLHIKKLENNHKRDLEASHLRIWSFNLPTHCRHRCRSLNKSSPFTQKPLCSDVQPLVFKLFYLNLTTPYSQKVNGMKCTTLYLYFSIVKIDNPKQPKVDTMKYTTPYLHFPFFKIVNPLWPKVGKMKYVTLSFQIVYRHSDFTHVSIDFLSINALKIDSTSSHTQQKQSLQIC